MRAIVALVAGGAAMLLGIGAVIFAFAWLAGLVLAVVVTLMAGPLEPGAWLAVVVNLAIGVFVLALGLASIFVGPRLRAHIARGAEGVRAGHGTP